MIEDVPPGPLDTNCEAMGVSYEDGTRGVMLRFSTPQGASYFFVGEEQARNFAERVAKVAEPPSGIITPPSKSLVIPG